MKKKLIAVMAMTLLLTGCGKIPTLENGQDAVVEFGDGTMYSVDEIWKEMKDTYGLQVLLDKIDSKILEEELKDKKDDIDQYVSSYESYIKSSYVDDNGNYDEEALLSDLSSYYNYNSLEDFLTQVRISYMKDTVTSDYAKTLITDKEISTYYKNESVGDIHGIHILVKPASTSEADLATAKTKVEEIIKAIKADVKSGTSVADAFAKYKDNEDVTYEDLDFFNKGDMEEAFETAAYALKDGAYTSEPVKTSYGYHVIFRVESKDKDTLDNLKDSIKETLATNKVSDDATVAINAMVELRKTYGVDFKDSELKSDYDKYINYQINNANSNSTTN